MATVMALRACLAAAWAFGCGLALHPLLGAQVMQLTERTPALTSWHRPTRKRANATRQSSNILRQRLSKENSSVASCPTSCSEGTFAPFKNWEGTGASKGVGQGVMKTWQTAFPSASIFVEDSQSTCTATSACEPSVTLSVVTELGQASCTAVESQNTFEAVPWEKNVALKEFTTPAAMPAGGTTREYVVALPPKVDCSSKSKCPVVVSLHGHGEHASTDLMQGWAYLNYMHHDSACRDSLGSVMLFPHLIEGESWVADGLACFENFVFPLLEDIDSTEGGIDMERVGLVGYSEGGVGAVQGAMLYPNVFTVVAAGSPVLPVPNWANVPLQPPQHNGSSKLQVLAVAYGEDDIMGDVPASLEHLVNMMTEHQVIKGAQLHVRMHPESKHITAYEALFNNWGKLFQVLWKGDFDSLSSW